jgi:hypothetical protein
MEIPWDAGIVADVSAVVFGTGDSSERRRSMWEHWVMGYVEPFKGKCVIVANSGLRKRMRAVRRGFMELPEIKIKNPEKYLNSYARNWAATAKAWKL